MTEGTFLQAEADPHVRLRRHLLASGAALPPPAVDLLEASAAGFLSARGDAVLEGLRQHGVSLVQLDEPLSEDQFLALGSLLGTALPETDPTVQPFVHREVILNLWSAHGQTDDVTRQPFATNYISLHTENSARRVEEQPRLIVLMCIAPGDASTAAQTVLVPAADVAGRLSTRELAVLSRTRYRRSPDGPPIVRDGNGRTVFSFRDFLAQPLEWAYDGADSGADLVNNAIRSLLAAMYESHRAVGTRWTRGMLAIIDNTVFFHGRTAGAARPSAQRRHLKRLRIL